MQGTTIDLGRGTGGRAGAVLVGTDGSQTATKAVVTAAKLALDNHLDLVIALGYRPKSAAALKALDAYMPDTELWRLGPGAQGEQHVQAAIAAARQVVGDEVRVRGRCEPGNPARLLLELADEVHAPAIVVGNVGMTGWGHRRSVPHRITAHASCDVVVVDTDSWAKGGVAPEAPISALVRRANQG
jgi:nucleotide-binding universal stress UspA family protein